MYNDEGYTLGWDTDQPFGLSNCRHPTFNCRHPTFGLAPNLSVYRVSQVLSLAKNGR